MTTDSLTVRLDAVPTGGTFTIPGFNPNDVWLRTDVPGSTPDEERPVRLSDGGSVYLRKDAPVIPVAYKAVRV